MRVLILLLIYYNSFATPSNFSLLRAIKQILNPYLHNSMQNYFPIPSEAPCNNILKKFEQSFINFPKKSKIINCPKLFTNLKKKLFFMIIY